MRTLLRLRSLLPLVALLASLAAAQDTLLITHVTVIDVRSGKRLPDRTVEVRANKIVDVRRARVHERTTGATVVDGTGKFLIPGLWDMHAHVYSTARTFPLFLANGVTGIRNMATNKPADIFLWRDEIASGKRLGPRIVACGKMVDGPQPVDPDESVEILTPADALPVVQRMKKDGAEFIKVYDRLPRETYYAVAAAAKQVQLPFAGHVPNAMRAEETSLAGQRSIEHFGGVLEGCSTQEAEIMRRRAGPPPSDPAQFPIRIAAAGRLMLGSQDESRCRALAATFVRRHTWQTPTLVTTYHRTFPSDEEYKNDPWLRYVPADARDEWLPSRSMFVRFSPPEYFAFRRAAFEREKVVIKMMRRAGVPFLAGTDDAVFPGSSIHRELALLVESGLTPLEALQAATLEPARYFREEGTAGTVARGKRADLVVLDADPLSDIGNTRTVRAVVANGRLLDRDHLDAMLAEAEAAAKKK